MKISINRLNNKGNRPITNVVARILFLILA